MADALIPFGGTVNQIVDLMQLGGVIYNLVSSKTIYEHSPVVVASNVEPFSYGTVWLINSDGLSLPIPWNPEQPLPLQANDVNPRLEYVRSEKTLKYTVSSSSGYGGTYKAAVICVP